MPSYCKEHKTRANFNYKGLPAKFCAKCKTDDMVDVRSKKCHCGLSQPNFNFKGLKAEYCIECKTENMIDVHNKKCIHNKQFCWDCCPLELLKRICRLRIRQIFPKHPNPEEVLGTINYQIVYNHIKSQMTKEMTYLNYGNGSKQWSLDHIIPIMFDNPTDEETIQRLHYSNLQPMFGNSKKHNSMRLEDIYTLANHWDTLTPELQIQVHHIRHNDDKLLYGILPVEEKKQKFKLILKSKIINN